MDSRITTLILGADSEIAICTIEYLAKNNHNLVLLSRNIKNLKNLKKKLVSKYKILVEIINLDFNQCHLFKKKINQIKLTPNLLISFLGKVGNSNEDLSDSTSFINNIFSNFIGPAYFIEVFIQEKNISKKKLTIVGVTSVAGNRGRAKNYLYGSSKAAFTHFLSGIRQKYFNQNVVIKTIILGPVRTKASLSNQSRFLSISTDKAAKLVYKSTMNSREIFYSPKWRLILFIISLIPEFIYKKIKLD